METNFRFTFYRFVGPRGNRSTELVRDVSLADGMRGLVDAKNEAINACRDKVQAWASSIGISLRSNAPYPSPKYPGKVWVDFRFGGLTL